MKKYFIVTIVFCFNLCHSQNNNLNQSATVHVSGGKSPAELFNEAGKEQGMFELGRGQYKIVKVGGSGFVSLSTLRKRVEEQISVFATNNNLTFKLINTEEQKTSFGIFPKVTSTYQMFDSNGNFFLSEEDKAKERDRVIKELKQMKELFDLGLITKEDFETKKTELVKFLN